MDSTELRLDRDIARSFLHAPTNTISYRPIHMTNEPNQLMMINTPSLGLYNNFLPQPHPNAQLGYPTNSHLIPMYYDVIIDTVTDYDILYPIAKETKKYYCNSKNDEESIYPRYHVQRLDEHAVSMNFTHDYDSISNWSTHPMENPIKNVRFTDTPTWIPYSKQSIQQTPIPLDQYYFHPETITSIDSQPSSVRYINTPFFWFRPVLDQNYAICIPTTRPSLHAFITPAFDSPLTINSTPNPIRL